VLLHDYHIRIGDHGRALELVGIAAELFRLLKLNVQPHNPDGSGTETITLETRRRLAWSCFTMGLGFPCLEELDMLKGSDMGGLQLPCNERNFTLGIPCSTPTLVKECLDKDGGTAANTVENLGLAAYFVRLVRLRKGVLR
jgi:hypothetical protein